MLFFNLIVGTPPKNCTWKADADISFCAPAMGVYEGEVDKWGRPLRVASYRSSSQRSSYSMRKSSLCSSTGRASAATAEPSLRARWTERLSGRWSRISQSLGLKSSRSSRAQHGARPAKPRPPSALWKLVRNVRKSFGRSARVLPPPDTASKMAGASATAAAPAVAVVPSAESAHDGGITASSGDAGGRRAQAEVEHTRAPVNKADGRPARAEKAKALPPRVYTPKAVRDAHRAGYGEKQKPWGKPAAPNEPTLASVTLGGGL